jgi:hypothetical protein
MAARRKTPTTAGAPIPLAPVDLLAGLAPGLELCADDVPTGLDPDGDETARLTVAEAGRQLRAGDGTIRRLIRTAAVEPAEPTTPPRDEPMRAGVVPRTRERPGE